MDQKYLLTYDINIIVKGGQVVSSSYAWFSTEEDMDEFIESNKRNPYFNINEKIEILSCNALE